MMNVVNVCARTWYPDRRPHDRPNPKQPSPRVPHTQGTRPTDGMTTHHCDELRVLREAQLEVDGRRGVERDVRYPTRLDGVCKGRRTEGDDKQAVRSLTALACDLDAEVLALARGADDVERVRRRKRRELRSHDHSREKASDWQR